MKQPNKILYLFGICLFITGCHVGRYFYWNFADIKDHKKFPKTAIAASSSPFQFKESPSKNTIEAPFVYNGQEYTFEKGIAKMGTVAFLVIRNDTIVYEWYTKNKDSTLIVPSFSMAKSFTSALVGIAIQEEYIKNVQDPITNYIPSLASEPFDKITLEHLLNMRSGLKFSESYVNPFGHVAKFYYGLNLKKFSKNLKSKQAPNQSFDYISSNTQFLGWAVEEATGIKLADYLKEKIWKPLGMEFDASWSLDSKKQGNAKAFCCINARARDFAKFGRLYLHKGNWEGAQIIDSSWIEKSTRFNTNGGQYKYQWWRSGLLFEDDFYAQGILGQYIYVNPQKNIIIVRLGKRYGKVFWPRLFQNLSKFYL